MKRIAYRCLLLATVALSSACTWVDLSQQGEKVRVLDATEVSSCKLLGQTTSNTTAKVAGVRRHDNAINYELVALARNAAARMGGDTIVAEASESDGHQTFLVYRCIQN